MVKNMKAIQKKQQGFTIIELVVVILLLGILTATALPRFMSVTAQAHTAVVQGVQGSLQTGIAMFRAAWTAQGEPLAGTVINSFGDANARLTNSATGFPQGSIANGTGITANAAGAAECVQVYRRLLQVGGVPTVANNGMTTAPTRAQLNAEANDFIAYVTAANVCNYAYAEEQIPANGRARLLSYNTTTGVVTLGQSAVLP